MSIGNIDDLDALQLSPAPGWWCSVLVYGEGDEPTGDVSTEPVIGWAVLRNGEIVPMVSGGAGPAWNAEADESAFVFHESALTGTETLDDYVRSHHPSYPGKEHP